MRKSERLFQILGLVDGPSMIEEAETVRRSRPWRRIGAAVACLAAVLGLGLLWRSGAFPDPGAMSGGAGGGSNTGAGGAGHDGGSTFMSYAGPVLPLTTLEDPSGLTAERRTVWDFAMGSYADGEPRQWGAEVTDGYVLTNPTEEEISVTALYPFAGNFADLGKILPAVTVEGEAIAPTLYDGPYAGTFVDTQGHVDPEDGEAWNLHDLSSFDDYRRLMTDGTYQDAALSEYPTLDIPVTVYEFGSFSGPLGSYPAATQAVSFTIDETATEILCCGFNGYERDGDFRRYSYFIPNGQRREWETKRLIVLGEDIGDYTLQGYRDGGCDPGDEIEGVGCTVTRREMALDAVLDQLCRDYQESYRQGRAADQEDVFDTLSPAMYRGAVARFIAQYTALSGAPKQRYSDGRLEDILSETLYHSRVMYLAFPVTVPAGGSVTVECALWKEPSYDFYCGGGDDVDIQGYELAARLGSTLAFTGQTAALAHTEGIEIVRQSFGFDLEAGTTEVSLDPEEEHWYLEIRPRR